jgi:hypothetical protein
MLKNQNGVNMQIETREQGFRFNIAASGLWIPFARNGECDQ